MGFKCNPIPQVFLIGRQLKGFNDLNQHNLLMLIKPKSVLYLLKWVFFDMFQLVACFVPWHYADSYKFLNVLD